MVLHCIVVHCILVWNIRSVAFWLVVLRQIFGPTWACFTERTQLSVAIWMRTQAPNCQKCSNQRAVWPYLGGCYAQEILAYQGVTSWKRRPCDSVVGGRAANVQFQRCARPEPGKSSQDTTPTDSLASVCRKGRAAQLLKGSMDAVQLLTAPTQPITLLATSLKPDRTL